MCDKMDILLFTPNKVWNLKKRVCNFQVEQSTSVNQVGGSKRQHNGVLVNGTHYMRRADPEHR